MQKKKVSDNFSTSWREQAWWRLVPESQLNAASTECKNLFLIEQNQALSSALKGLSGLMTLIWLVTYATDAAAGVLEKTIYLRLYYQSYLAILIAASFSGWLSEKSGHIQNVILFSFLQLCAIQGFITQFTNQSTVIFVMIANTIATAISQSNTFKLLIYFALSNGAYFYISGDLVRLKSSIEVSFLFCVMLIQIMLLTTPGTYLYHKIKSFIEIYNKDLAIRTNLEIVIKTSEATSTFLSQNYRDRINYATSFLGLDYADAFKLVTQLRRRNRVAVLYQDIRAFTSTMRISKEAENTIKSMMSQSAEKIDQNWGNASDKGDLILAYFDEEKDEVNVNLSLYSAFELNKITQEVNKTSDVKIRRYPILTLASCSTGNVASTRKRLIDAKGDAANLGARIDELTKSKELQHMIDSQDIILDENYYKQMSIMHPELNASKVSLEDFGIKIRDFEEMTHIFILKHSEVNQNYFVTKLKAFIEDILKNKKQNLDNYFKNINDGGQSK